MKDIASNLYYESHQVMSEVVVFGDVGTKFYMVLKGVM